MRRERDYQRSKVYAWERQEFGWDKDILTLSECEKVARSILPDVVVSDGRGRVKACAVPWENKIKLPRWARTRWVVLHEVAHIVAYRNWAAWHGKEFMANYIDLLSRYYKRDKDALWQSALSAGLRVGY